MVTRTGFEPMYACVKGMCVKPLHQRAILMVGLGGLEPPTSRLSGVRSNQLSYKPTNKTFFILHYFLTICNSFCKIYDFFADILTLYYINLIL